MTAIKVEHLKKTFGQQCVIDDLSFSIEENKICGFLGPNGSGKTTTFKLLNSLIKADSGNIEILGQKISSNQSSKDIKFLQDVPDFYDYMTANEYLKFICELNSLDNIKQRVSDTLELVGLPRESKKRIRTFSRGMKQRIGIAANIISEPKILLLDEPVSALDPVGRKAIFDLIESLKGKMTILFSTHIIDDVERVSDQIIVIKKGKKILEGTVSEMKQHFKSEGLEIEFLNENAAQVFLKHFDEADSQLDESKLNLKISSKEMNLADLQQKIFELLSREKITVNSLKISGPSLEEVFIEEVSMAEQEEANQ